MGPLFFSLVYFFIFFHFRFLFQFLSMFFSFFLCFSFFHFLLLYFPFVFLFQKNILSFFILFLFFLFSGAQRLWRHSRIPWGKVHILSFICFVLARRHFSLWNSAHSGDDHVESRIWWAAGGFKSYFRSRIARLVPSMRRLTHLSLVSSSQF